jgi:putative DNA primase/helicase
MTHSFAGDDRRDCRDHVRRLLGIERDLASRRPAVPRWQPAELRPPDDLGRNRALVLWRAAIDPRDTLADVYLRSRELELDDDVAAVLRWHPGLGAMVALFRSVETEEPQAISRTFLDPGGRKRGRSGLLSPPPAYHL